MKQGKGWVWAAALVLASVQALFNASAAELQVGDQPEFRLGTDSDGNEVTLASLRGQVVLVNFWTSWCGPCMKEMPVLVGLNKIIAPYGGQVVSINVKEDRTIFRNMAKKLRPHGVLPLHDKNGRLHEAMGGVGFPYTVIFDREGVVYKIHSGYGEKTAEHFVDDMNALFMRDPEHVKQVKARLEAGAANAAGSP